MEGNLGVKSGFILKDLLYSRHGSDNFWNIVMITKDWSTKILNCMTPGTGFFMLVRGHIHHLMKIHYFFKIFSTLGPCFRQTKCVVMMIREESTTILDLMTPCKGLFSWGMFM